MSNTNKRVLLDEAEKQTKEVENLKKWLRNSIGFSTITMVIAYFGITGFGFRFICGVLGVVLTIFFICSAFIINLGIRNGRRNVEKILGTAEKI
ncbi:MAG: hypothetical protein Q4F66_04970 [Clostridium sp.]|nr:hypothetical protein [Clostridium sp.]